MRPRDAGGRRADGRLLRGPPDELQKWWGLIEEAVARIEAHLDGEVLDLELQLNVSDWQHPKGAASTVPLNADGGQTGEAATCLITIYPAASAHGPEFERTVAAHEVFHCFVADLVGLDSFYSLLKLSPWRGEGAPEWVGFKVAEEWTGPDYKRIFPWDEYLKTPERRLFQRSYDAVGFYAHMDESGIDPWPLLKDILAAPSNPAAYTEAVALNADHFSDTWPSGFARRPDWGAKWTTVGPGIQDAKPAPIPALKLKPGTSATVTAPDRANALRALDLAAPVVELRLKPGGFAHGVLRDTSGGEYPLKDTTFCTDSNGCCPPNQAPKSPTWPAPAGVAILALNGGEASATATLKARPKKAADCEPLPPTSLGIVDPPGDDPFGDYPSRAITTPGQCFLSSPREDGTRAWVLNFQGFQIAAPVFTGPGQYALPGAATYGPTSPYANASIAAGTDHHTRALKANGAGSFTVAGGMQSGTVGATLGAYGDPPIHGPITVSGQWSCMQQYGYFPGLPLG